MHYRFLQGAMVTGLTTALSMVLSTSVSAASVPESVQVLAQEHAAMNQILQQGSTGHWVATLQADLYLLGYHSVGMDDGIFGPKTLGALKSFQTANGFQPTGVTSGPVWQDILAGFHLTPRYRGPMTFGVNVPAVPAGSHPALFQSLSLGSQGHWVATLQADLKLLGYSQVSTDNGVFGQGTLQAMQAFQKDHGIPVTQETTYATWKQILTTLGVLGPQTQLLQTGSPTGTPQTSNQADESGTGNSSSQPASPTQSNASTAPSPNANTIDGRPVLKVYHMEATAYGPSLKDNYPYGPVDAFGQPLASGMVAVDPSLIPLKSYVYVKGYTDSHLPSGGFLGRAMDTGGAIKGQRIDIFMNTNSQTVSNFGIEPVTVYVLGK